MRSGTLVAAVLMAVLMPQLGNAEVSQSAEPPQAARSDTGQGAPIVYAGDLYYPTGPTVFFDPRVMVPTGSYEGVPLYADTTLEPYSVVYAPIGGKLMRPYEKRRAGAVEGTIGSRTPSFPVERDVDVSAATAATGLQFPPPGGEVPDGMPVASIPEPVGTAGAVMAVVRRPSTTLIRPVVAPRPTGVESIPRPRSNEGIWVKYAGATWYADGAVEYAPAKLVKVGEYHGFPVFRQQNRKERAIYIPSVEGGPLTRYRPKP